MAGDIYLILLFIVAVSTVVAFNNTTKSKTCLNDMNTIKELLHPDRYDKAMHPCENGEPVVVRVGLYIIAINNIKESDMELDMQVYYRQTWRDPRLAFEGLNLTDKEYITFSPGYVWDKVWLPDTYFENEKTGKIHTIMTKNQLLRLHQDGTVVFSTRLTLTMSCPMEFYDFPMDHQKCNLVIMSYGHTNKELNLKWMTNKTQTTVYRNEFNIPQFDLVEIETKTNINRYIVGDFDVLILDLHLHRRIEFYLTHNYIPAILVVIISWLSFWVDRECAPARVGMGITTILTMTTLLIGVGQQGLPVVSYIKALDWYYIGCFLFVFVGLCEYSVVNYFSTKHKTFLKEQRLKDASNSIEKGDDEMQLRTCRENFPSQFSIMRELQDEPDVTKETGDDASMTLNISDSIENAVRVLYPILFLIFNAFYWLTYRKSLLGD